MIIVQLTGGLGNQLFQYAMGRSIASRNNTTLKLDINFFKTYEWHDYSIGPFCINEVIASEEDFRQINAVNNTVINKIKRKVFGSEPVMIHERDMLFNPAYLGIKDPAYLFGYWQCEKYFKDNEAILRNEFRIKPAPSPANAALLEKINTTQAVSLHIRRGNFVSVDAVSKTHGTCSMEYYAAAVEKILSVCSNPVFYVFSDDIPWAKENLSIGQPCFFVDINDDKTDYEDLRLMSSCQHHIMANSTFSWWGAWLNNKPGKVVVAPKQWFADEEKNKMTRDLIPGSWLKL